MSLFNDLLEADAAKVTERPEKKVEVKRLSELLGHKAEVTVSAVAPKRYSEIQRQAVQLGKKGGVKDYDPYFLKVMTVVEGVKDPDVKDKKLMEHFGAATPKELVGKLFLAGEIEELYEAIIALCGYDSDDEEAEEELKN